MYLNLHVPSKFKTYNTTLHYGMDQTYYVYSNDDQGKYYKNCKFYDPPPPGAGVLMLRCGHISRYSEYALSSTLSICSTLIAIVLSDDNVVFLCNFWLLFIIMGMLIWKYEPIWQWESDTQVTVKACRPLVTWINHVYCSFQWHHCALCAFFNSLRMPIDRFGRCHI